MTITSKLGALTFAAALAATALPAMAQSTSPATNGTTTGMTPGTTMGTPATGTTMTPATGTTMAPANGTMGNNTTMGMGANTGNSPTDRNPVMTMAGETRVSKVIGSAVYNDHNEKLGTVDDVLIAKNGKMSAVLSVGGFLGIDAKYVEVPYANLTFGNTQNNSDAKVMLKGATKATLTSQASYKYYRS